MGLFDWLKPRPTGPSAPKSQVPAPPPPAAPLPPSVSHGIMAALNKLRKSGWYPETIDEEGDPTASKFSGMPWLKDGESHPCCETCGGKMPLFLQLNSDDLPSEAGLPFGNGLLQFFYCTHCDDGIACESWAPFSKCTLIRVLSPIEDGGISEESMGTPIGDTKRIVGWTEFLDYPSYEESISLGARKGIEIDEETEEHTEETRPADGDKLLGWPNWIQGVEYPACPDCGTAMKYLFQIDSERSIPHMFGDCGCGHITQCPKHPHRLAFGWACC